MELLGTSADATEGSSLSLGYPQVDAERGIWGKWFISCKMIPGEMAGQGESEESKGRKPHGVWVKGVYPVPTGVPWGPVQNISHSHPNREARRLGYGLPVPPFIS